MGKRVCAHNRLVRRNLRASDFGEQAAGFIQLIQLQLGLDPKAFLAHGQRHSHFFEGGVACAFADPVDRALDLANAGPHRGERIRHGQTEIVMAMRAQGNVIRIIQVLPHLQEHLAIFLGHGEADRVRQIQHRGAVLYRHCARPAQKFDFGAAPTLGRKFHFSDEIPRQLDHRTDGFERLLARHVEFYLQVKIRRSQKDMHARRLRGLQSLGGRQDVVFSGPRQGGNRDFFHFTGHSHYGFQVAFRRNGEAGLDDVDTERGELVRHTDLFIRIHREAGRLFAVAERGVEDAYVAHGYPQCDSYSYARGGVSSPIYLDTVFYNSPLYYAWG